MMGLEGLRPMTMTDIEVYKMRLQEGQHLAWCYYFPFLLLFSQSRSRAILIQEDAGCLCVYLLRTAKGKTPKLHLYFPPLPMNPAVFRRCLQRIHDFNQEEKAAILWIDGHHIDSLQGTAGLTVLFREQEYLYAPNHFHDLSGGKFRKLRQNLSKVNQLPGLHIQDYHAGHRDECINLLRTWRDQQGEKYEGSADYSYVKSCLKLAHQFNKKDLFGKVFLIRDRICSFGFVGETYPGVANLFIGKSEHQITGLNYFMQYHLILSLADYPVLNNASDMGYPGLRFAKQHLRPIAMHDVYRARQLGKI